MSDLKTRRMRLLKELEGYVKDLRDAEYLTEEDRRIAESIIKEYERIIEGLRRELNE